MVWSVATKPRCTFNDKDLGRARFKGSEVQETHQPLESLLEQRGPHWERHLKFLRDPQLGTHSPPLPALPCTQAPQAQTDLGWRLGSASSQLCTHISYPKRPMGSLASVCITPLLTSKEAFCWCVVGEVSWLRVRKVFLEGPSLLSQLSCYSHLGALVHGEWISYQCTEVRGDAHLPASK